jgi:YVTN family beta-propeller protein
MSISGFGIAFAEEEVVMTIPVGDAPFAIAFNSDNGYMYVTNAASARVTVIDGSTNEVIKTIPVGNAPEAIAFNSDNGYVYVTNRNSDTVSVIDSSTNEVIKTIPVEDSPFAIAFNSDNGYMYVTNGAGTVSMIDSSTNEVIKTIPVGTRPISIAFNSDNGYMYVTNGGIGNAVDFVAVIDGSTNEVIKTIPVGTRPEAIAFNSDNGYMYVANFDSGTVWVIDSSTNEVIKTIPVGNAPVGVAFNSDNGYVYVTNFDSDTVSVIDSSTNEVIKTIPVGDAPFGVAFNSDNGYMYVTNIGSMTISVISSNTISLEPPTATTITSSIDSNGYQVENKSSTVSTSITFEVTAIQGTNEIAGFECSLDNSPFSNCSISNPSTIEYDSLAVDREHLFQVRAIDSQGNTDPKPAVFIWTVLTAEQALDKLIDTIDHMSLPKGTATSLKGPLNAAAKQLDNSNEEGACGSLGAFLNQLDAKEGNGQLTSQQATELRQQAIAIQQQIGCAAASSASATSQSNSPIDSMIDSTISNIESFQSKESGKAIDSVKKGMGFYSKFLNPSSK